MTVLRTTVLIGAPAGIVRAVLDEVGTAKVRLLGRSYPVRIDLAETGAGIVLTCSVSWRRFGAVLDPLLGRKRVLAQLTALSEQVRGRAAGAGG